MKNAIMYYYNIRVNDVHQTSDYYWFLYNNKKYHLYRTERQDIDNVIEIVNILIKNKIKCHLPIMNVQNSYVTIINEKEYILLEIIIDSKEKVILNDIYEMYKIEVNEPKYKRNWIELWSNKIDYLELQLAEFGKKHPLLRQSFPYFCGLAENAIEMLEEITVNKYKINHIKMKDQLIEFYNPLNMVIDLKTRDLSEYLKRNVKQSYMIEEINYIINRFKLEKDETKLLFARLMFPNYYFNEFEEIMAKEKDEQVIIKYINCIDNNEHLLKETYKYLSNIIEMPNIEWLTTNDF